MADYSPYLISLGDTNYPAIHTAFVNATEGVATEVENGRGGFGTLGLRINDLPTKAYVQSAITTGGVDVSTIGNPNDFVMISPSGDTFVGINKDTILFNQIFWSAT